METSVTVLHPPPGSPVTRGEVVLDLAGRVRDVVSRLSADDWSRPVPHLPDWSVHHLVAHLAGIAPLSLAGLDDAAAWVPAPTEVAAFNARRLEQWLALPRSELLEQLEDAPRRLVTEVDRDPQAPTPFHGHTVVPRHIVTAGLVAELAVHGWDLAQVLGAPWALLPEHADAALARNTTMFDVMLLRDRARGLRAGFELRVRGGHAHRFAIRDGHATTDVPATGPVDCRMTGTAEAWLLITHRRRRPLRYVVTGRLVSTGRRPWLGPRLPALVPPI